MAHKVEFKPDDYSVPRASRYCVVPPGNEAMATLNYKSLLTKRMDRTALIDGMKKVGFPWTTAPIRSSTWKTYKECPRKFMFQYRFGLKAHEYVPALYRGQVCHWIREALWTGATHQEALVGVGRIADEMTKQLQDMTNEIGILPNGRDLEATLTEHDRLIQKCRAMMLALDAAYPINRDRWDIVEVEQLYDHKYPGLYAHVRTIPDAILREKDSGDLWLSQLKTTEVDPLSWRFGLDFDFQTKLERLVTHLAGRETVGTIHEIVKLPTIRQKRNQTFPEYMEEVRQWYQKKLRETPNNPPLVRSLVRWTEPVVTEEFLVQLQEMSRACAARPNPNRYYRVRACNGKYGNRPCPYQVLCASPAADWPRIAADRFIQHFREDDEEDT